MGRTKEKKKKIEKNSRGAFIRTKSKLTDPINRLPPLLQALLPRPGHPSAVA